MTEAKPSRVARACEQAPSLVGRAALIVLPLIVLWPWLRDGARLGVQDWDVQASHRLLVRDALLLHHQFPSWNPYACGGFPAWGYVEAGTIVVSPWLPFYLLADLRTAMRVELLGMAVLGAVGCWLAAGRFTRASGARLLVVALCAVNGRWALQAAVGHTWHLVYALLPWCLFLFERAREAPRPSRIAALATALALLVYWGGLYPLPHTLLMLALWALGLALLERTARPPVVLAVAGLLALALAAPKLLPVLATMERAPRLIDSTEILRPAWLPAILTARDQSLRARPAPVWPYAWHEWGMYLGVAGVALLLAGLVLVRRRREALLFAIGALFVVLAGGAFASWAPWTWMHAHLPLFRSQHVPSRFLYPAALLLALAAASGLGRVAERARRLDLALAIVALALGVDIALVGQRAMRESLRLSQPEVARAAEFRFAQVSPLHYGAAHGDSMLLPMLANVGVIDCYGTPPFDEHGALAASDPAYRGEAVVDGGAAHVERWSPNRVTIAVERAPADARLVYNMNYDAGWSARLRQGAAERALPVVSDHARVACVLPAGASTVTFSYSPPGLRAGLALLLLALGTIAFALWRQRRR